MIDRGLGMICFFEAGYGFASQNTDLLILTPILVVFGILNLMWVKNGARPS